MGNFTSGKYSTHLKWGEKKRDPLNIGEHEKKLGKNKVFKIYIRNHCTQNWNP